MLYCYRHTKVKAMSVEVTKLKQFLKNLDTDLATLLNGDNNSNEENNSKATDDNLNKKQTREITNDNSDGTSNILRPTLPVRARIHFCTLLFGEDKDPSTVIVPWKNLGPLLIKLEK
jgi:hypothetical protein